MTALPTNREELQRLLNDAHRQGKEQADAAHAEACRVLRERIAELEARVPVVPEPLEVEIEAELAKWWPVGPGWRAGFSEGVLWARRAANLQGASERMLQPGQVAVDEADLDRVVLAPVKWGWDCEGCRVMEITARRVLAVKREDGER